MDQKLRLLLLGTALAPALSLSAQTRYLDEVFTNAEINVTSNVVFGTNIRWLPFDGTSTVDLHMDIYQPDQAVDAETARPLMVYIHTGNALPPIINGSPNGAKTDSTAVEICRRFARLGYVSAAVEYRPGWNPLAPTEEERRGQLLNAIYRALHDVKQAVRTMKAQADTYRIDPNRVVLVGEGTGGYIAQAYVTLDKGEEMFIEKFRPDPFDLNTSYIDTMIVGNIEGYCPTANPCLTLYQPNGFSSEVHAAVNLGGALADTSWLEPGDVPMISFHTVFDPFAPFTEGIVIVPTTGGPVVPVQGSNMVQQLANDYGNNDAFASLPDGDPYTDRARSLYGTTIDGVTIFPTPEGLFPFIRPRWQAPLSDEASPWQWWDPTSPQAVATPPGAPEGVTTHMLSIASNPDMSPGKARAYIDTIMGYSAPRLYAVLDLNVGLNEMTDLGTGVELFPNPAQDQVHILSEKAAIRRLELRDIHGRLVRAERLSSDRYILERKGLEAGVYFVVLQFDNGTVTRKLILE